MRTIIENFLREESGASVVDMTILMAALSGLALAVMTQVSNGMDDLTNEMEATIIAQDAAPAW